MGSLAIAHRRFSNQYLSAPDLKKPADVVHWLGAVQAQDYHGAKWALGQRMHQASDAEIEEAFARGEILRTHLLRPTWHFVAPADIRWMLNLTAPVFGQRPVTTMVGSNSTMQYSNAPIS